MKDCNYLQKMKKGVRAVSVIHTSYVIFMVAVFLRYNSFIHIPAILKGILVAYTIIAFGCIFYRTNVLLVCPFCKKSFSSSMKYRMFSGQAIPERCPHCSVVIDYTHNL